MCAEVTLVWLLRSSVSCLVNITVKINNLTPLFEVKKILSVLMQSPASKYLAPNMWTVFWQGALVGESALGFKLYTLLSIVYVGCIL